MKRRSENALGAGLARCGNCAKVWPVERLRPVVDLLRRLEPGDVFPSGECPECGALAIPYQQALWAGPKLVREPDGLAALRSYWWGREPVQDWTYTSFVVDPASYARVLDRLGQWWTHPASFWAALPAHAVVFTSL
jgi:hypothetical protein